MELQPTHQPFGLSLPEKNVSLNFQETTFNRIEEMRQVVINCLQAYRLSIAQPRPPLAAKLTAEQIAAYNRTVPIGLEAREGGGVRLLLLYPIDEGALTALQPVFERIANSLIPAGKMTLALNASILGENSQSLIFKIISNFGRVIQNLEYRDSFGSHDAEKQKQLLTLIQSCPQIDALDLSKAAGLTERQLKMLLECVSLKELALPSGIDLKIDILQQIACSYPRLQKFSAAGCPIHSNALLAFLSENPWLTALDVSHTAVEDDFLIALRNARFCSRLLAHLFLAGTKVTDKGLKALAEVERFCLQTVDLRGCSAISPQGVDFLLKQHPGVYLRALEEPLPCPDEIDEETRLIACLNRYLKAFFNDPLAEMIQEKCGERWLSVNPGKKAVSDLAERNCFFSEQVADFIKEKPVSVEIGYAAFRSKSGQPLAQFLSSLSPAIQQLNISDWNDPSGEDLPEGFSSVFPQVVEMRFSNCPINEKTLVSIQANQLKKLVLTRCPAFALPAPQRLLGQFPQLEELILEDCPQISLKAFAVLAKGHQLRCAYLCSGDLSLDEVISPEDWEALFRQLREQPEKEAAAFFKTLSKVLKVDSVNCPELLEIAYLKKIPELEERCNQFMDDHFKGLLCIAQGDQNRLSVHLKGIASVSTITTRFLRNLAKGRQLDCRINYAPLQDHQKSFLANCFEILGPSLVCLDWAAEANVICPVADCVSYLRFCPALTSLKLTHFSLSGVGVKGLGKLCKTLRELHLISCMELGEMQGGAATASSLLHLGFKGCTKLRLPELQSVLGLFPSLQSLDLSDCPQLTDKAILTALEKCPGLAELNVGGIVLTEQTLSSHSLRLEKLAVLHAGRTQLSDKELQILCSKAPKLMNLVLDDNPVSQRGLLAALGNWPFLAELSLKRCAFVNDAFLEKLKQLPNSFQIVDVEGCGNISELAKGKLAQFLKQLASSSGVSNREGCKG